MIWFKRISLSVLTLILCLIITSAALLYTSAGVKLMVWGAKLALPELSIKDSSGALLNGFQLKQIKYDDGQIELAADQVNLTLSDRCLLIPEICISTLGLTGLNVSLPELPPSRSEPKDPVSEPTKKVIMPLPLRVEAVNLNDVNLDILGNKIAWQQFSSAAEIENSHLIIKPSNWQDIELTLADTAAVAETQPEQKEPSSSQPIVLPEVILPLSIDILGIKIYDFKLNGETPQQINLLELQAKAKGSEITIKKLSIDAPQGSIKTSANMTLTANYPLTLDANLDLTMPPLEDHHLSLEASGSLAKLNLDANLKGTLDAKVSGLLSPLDPKLPFDLLITGEHIQWPIHADPQFELTDTLIKAQGNLYQVSLDAIRLGTLGGTITGKADANWKDTVKWQGQLDFSQIQPGLKWPNVQGELNGKLQTSGRLTKHGGWYVDLPKLAIDGVIIEQPFTLNGQLNLKDSQGKGDIQLTTKGLTLKHGPNGLTAKGELTKNWAMTGKINAPDLALSIPGLRGHVQGQIDLSGKMAEPEINLALNGNSFDWQGQASLQSFELKGQVTPMPVLKADINLSASQGAFDTFKLNDLNLSLTGTEARHILTLNMAANPVAATLALEGKLDRETTWQGRLKQAEIDSMAGLWRLAQPTGLVYHFKTKHAEIPPHCWRQNRSSICLTEKLSAGPSGHAKLAVNRFTFDALKPLIPNSFDVKGQLDAAVSATWAPEKSPTVKAQITLPEGTVTQVLDTDETYKSPFTLGWDKITLNAEVKDDVLNADWLIAVTDNGDISGQAQITQLTTDQQINADLNIYKFMLGAFKPVIKDYDKFDGQVDANLALAGPIMHPAIDGLLKVTKLKAIGHQVPLDLEQANIQVNFSGYKARLEGDLFTPDGKLQLRGDGDWQNLKNWKTQLQVNGRELEIHSPPMLALRVSPDLTFAASPKKAEITGEIAIPWGRIKIDQLPESAVAVSGDEILLTDDLQPIETKKKIPFNLKTDIRVKIGDNVKLSAFGLNTELLGELNVRQKNRNPLVYGEINLQNGTYRSFAQELVINKGQLLFNGLVDQPYLSIEAIRNPDNIEDDVIAGLRVNGPADAPRIDVFSEPAMAQQNALSYLLRGKDLDSESGDQNSAMTTALISMGIARGGQLVGNVGEAFGIEELTLDTAGAGDESQVTIGGYIAPGLQVKYGVGIFNSIGEFTVRYRLMTDLYIEAVSGLDSAVDILYRFEFD